MIPTNLHQKTLKNTHLTSRISYLYFIQKRNYPSPGLILKSSPQILTLIPKRYITLSTKLNEKVLRDLNLSKNLIKCYYINKKGYITCSNPSTENITHEFITGNSLNKVFNIISAPAPSLIKSYVSGIYDPGKDPAFYDKHLNLLSNMFHKFIFTILGGTPITTKTELFLRIEHFLQNDINIHHHDYYPLAQHIIVSMMANLKCPLEVLLNLTDNRIDFCQYQNQPINAISCVEAVVIKYTLLDLMIACTNKITVVAQNPEHPETNNPTNIALSYSQSKQPFMDGVVKITFETFFNKKFFYDIKLRSNPVDQLPLTKGFLSLSSFINYEFFSSRFMGDLLRSAKSKNACTIEQMILKDYFKDLTKTINDKKQTIEQKIEFFVQTRNDIIFHPKIKTVIPSIITVPPVNISYNDYVLNNKLEHNFTLTIIKEELEKKDILNTLIPQNNQEQHANITIWHNTIFKIICRYPEPMKKNLLENFHKFKLLEYEHDL